MNADKFNCETGIALADGGVRLPYQAPQLAAFGKLVTLTQTGTMTGMEDGWQNGLCSDLIQPINTTFNMC